MSSDRLYQWTDQSDRKKAYFGVNFEEIKQNINREKGGRLYSLFIWKMNFIGYNYPKMEKEFKDKSLEFKIK